jgi:hypothetical protein
MFQKKSSLTMGEIKSLMKEKATEDIATGAVPNPKWGNGKLDLAAIRRILAAIN